MQIKRFMIASLTIATLALGLTACANLPVEVVEETSVEETQAPKVEETTGTTTTSKEISKEADEKTARQKETTSNQNTKSSTSSKNNSNSTSKTQTISKPTQSKKPTHSHSYKPVYKKVKYYVITKGCEEEGFYEGYKTKDKGHLDSYVDEYNLSYKTVLEDELDYYKCSCGAKKDL